MKILNLAFGALLRVSEANEVPISSHTYMGRLNDIQTALKPFKKMEMHFYDHFRTR